MTKKERLALLKQHITKRELLLAEIVHVVIYFIVVLAFIPTTINLLLFCVTCLFLLIGFGAVRDQFLLWLNERRCETETSSDEDNSDSDSSNSQGD